ncbi:hypothetical protein LTR85_007390 [Meristemomyces frigidus]|nr:hypothetical protein LTR85_007390 [Meristemomyces frigidus]
MRFFSAATGLGAVASVLAQSCPGRRHTPQGINASTTVVSSRTSRSFDFECMDWELTSNSTGFTATPTCAIGEWAWKKRANGTEKAYTLFTVKITPICGHFNEAEYYSAPKAADKREVSEDHESASSSTSADVIDEKKVAELGLFLLGGLKSRDRRDAENGLDVPNPPPNITDEEVEKYYNSRIRKMKEHRDVFVHAFNSSFSSFEHAVALAQDEVLAMAKDSHVADLVHGDGSSIDCIGRQYARHIIPAQNLAELGRGFAEYAHRAIQYMENARNSRVAGWKKQIIVPVDQSHLARLSPCQAYLGLTRHRMQKLAAFVDVNGLGKRDESLADSISDLGRFWEAVEDAEEKKKEEEEAAESDKMLKLAEAELPHAVELMNGQGEHAE